MNNFILKSCFIFFFLVPALARGGATLKQNEPCKRIVLYYHDILFNGTDAANATSARITNPSAVGSSLMGMMVVFDDPMTEDGRLASPAAARARGFYLYDEKDAYSAWFAYTLVFNSTEYRGSLSIMGDDPLAAKTRDLAVVGGTGDFFMARGIVTFQTDEVQGDFYFRLKMDIKLYECYKKWVN